MRVIRWKNSATGVESLNITATGIYFPVGKTDSSFKLKLSMASAGQTAGVDTVRDSSGSRTGYGAMNVSGITETKLGAVVSFATGIIVTAISGTLNAILDDEIAITSWPEVSLGRFPAIEDLVAYCYGSVPPLGLLASVLGVQYTYGAAGWVEAAAGGGLTPYADYTTLSAQAPTVGKIAQIPRLCGNGYFALRGNGTRWEVCPGESIVRDAGAGSAGYDLTATGAAYVPLVSYTIPAGLIGDGEEWEVDQHSMSLDVHASGNDSPYAQIGGQTMRGSIPTLTAINQVARVRGAFVRLASTLAARNGASSVDLYTGGTNSDITVDLASTQTLTAGFAPGAATNKMRLRHFCLRRIG